jgi:hypothetical protein
MASMAKYICLFAIILTGCSISYKFNSATAPSEAKTIAITQFYDDSPSGPPQLSQTFTEQLRDYFQQNTKLEVISDPLEADLILEGSIITYKTSPVAPSNNGGVDIAAQQKLTIVVHAQYTNTLQSEIEEKDRDDFEQNFSAFSLFDGEQSLSDVEDEKIDEINEQLIINIFTRSFDNW